MFIAELAAPNSLVVGLAIGVTLVSIQAFKRRLERSKLPNYDEIPNSVLHHLASRSRLAPFSGNVDVVIVGSGIGALAAASVLSRFYKVLVLEQHTTIGGSTHTYSDSGFEFDVGVHYVGCCLDRRFSPFRLIFDMLTDGKLKWNRINEQYDVAYNASTGERLEFTGDPKLNRKTILTHFPNVSPQALDRYYSRCFWARLWGMLVVGLKILPPFFTRILFPLVEPFFKRNALSTTLDVLKDCGLPEDVIGAITYSWGDYGTPPGASPFFIQAFMESHYDGGAFYPVGGSASIAKTLVASISRRGGYVFCGAPVESILTQETRRGIHRAVGVRVHGVDITAKRCVISGAGFQRTFGPKAEYELHDPLVSRIASKKQLSLIQDEQGNVALKSSPAFFSLFVALGALDEDLGLTGQNVWYLRDWSHDDNMAKLLSQKTVKEALQEDPPLVFVSNESAKDPDYNKRHPGKSSVNIICIAKSEWFQSLSETDHDHRGQEYEKIKSELTNVLLNILYKLFPKTRGHVIFSELGTPLSANKYLGREHGQIYNLDHTVARFGSVGALLALHPETTVKNLYLTGQDVFVVSVVGATFAGLCAAARTSALSLFFYAVPVLAAAVQMAMG